jgi:signal transduction histidine kinase
MTAGIGLFYESGDEINAFKKLNAALKDALKIKNKALVVEALRQILEIYNNYSATINERTFIYSLNTYKEYLFDRFEEAHFYYYSYRLTQRFSSSLDLRFDFKDLKNKEWVIKSLDFEPLIGRFYLTNATYYFHYLKKRDSAFWYLDEASKIFDNPTNFLQKERYLATELNRVGYLIEMGELDKAYNQINSISINEEGYLFELLKKYYYHRFWRLFEKKKKTDSLWKYKALYLNQEISLNQRKNLVKISELKALEKEKDNLELKNRNLIINSENQRNRSLLAGAITLLIMGGSLAYLIHKNTTKKRKIAEQEALIERQKVEALLKEQELVSLDAMIAGQEKERTKVANELHDDLGSLMATVKLHFDNVKVDKKDLALKNAQDLLEKAYQKIRGMAHAKNSGVMANQGLLPAVQKMTRIICETNALEITVEDFGLADRMENSLELTLFRILQELVANIIKHAEATKASIQFTQHEDKLNIIVEDNGKGFKMGKVKTASSGMGLNTIEKRIEYLEGTFTVDSVLGKGTSILIDIPV